VITLYDYWRSSASYRVRIALNLADLDWSAVPVNLLDAEHKSPAHLARNPQGLVPAIEIDGQMMTQSLAIIEYLDETRDLGLLPTDPIARAKTRAIAYAIAVDLHPVCNLGTARHAVAQSNGQITLDGWMQHFIGPGLAAVEQMLDGGNHCIGTNVTLADICLAPQIYNARRWHVPLDTLPKVRAVAEHLATLPAFAAAHPDQVKP
jgi:maleylacetoacetate isomerase